MSYLSLIGIKFGIYLLLYALLNWCLAPLGLAGYEQWKKHHNNQDLANMIICSMFGLCFFLFIGVALVNVTTYLDEIFSHAYGLTGFILMLGLTIFISYFSTPKTIKLFHKWKTTKQTKYFSRMTLLGTLSLYAFLIILTLFLKINIGAPMLYSGIKTMWHAGNMLVAQHESALLELKKVTDRAEAAAK